VGGMFQYLNPSLSLSTSRYLSWTMQSPFCHSFNYTLHNLPCPTIISCRDKILMIVSHLNLRKKLPFNIITSLFYFFTYAQYDCWAKKLEKEINQIGLGHIWRNPTENLPCARSTVYALFYWNKFHSLPVSGVD
jgi:hypothetical protein